MNKQKDSHMKGNTVLIYGINPITAVIKAGKRDIQNIICTENKYELIRKLLDDNNKSSVKIKVVDKQELNKYVDTTDTHQGVIAHVSKKEFTPLEQYLQQHKNLENDIIVALDQVTDTRNIGAIIRSCVAFGVKAILITEISMPNENSLMNKAASGALEYINLIKVTNLSAAITKLKKNEYWVVGMDVDTKSYLDTLPDFNKTLVIMGSEGKGMRELTKKNCDMLAKIPMNTVASIESLNISNAAAITLYELAKKTTKPHKT